MAGLFYTYTQRAATRAILSAPGAARILRSVSVTLTTRIGTRTHNVSSRVEAVLY